MNGLRTWSVFVAMVAASCGGDSGAATGSDTSTSADPTGLPGDTVGTTGPDATSSPDPTTAAVDGTGTSDCEDDAACTGPNAPICMMGQCVACTEASADACGQRDPAVPLCLPSGGCGQCTAEDDSACTDATPVCDLATNACVGCTRNDQCPGTACDAAIGSCFSTDCIIRVAEDGSGDFVDIGSAVAAIAADDACVVTIAANGADFGYIEHITVVDGRRVAFLADGADVIWSGPAGIALTVDAGAVAYADGFAFYGGLEVDDGALHLDHDDVFVEFEFAEAGVRVTSDTASVSLVDSWVHVTQGGPAVLLDGGHADVAYSTLLGGTTALACGPAQTASIRASLLLAHGDLDPVDCIGVDISYTASEVVYAGVGNQSLGPEQDAWFEGERFIRLAADPPVLLGATARWTTGDPPFDIDGRPRPAVDGTMTYAGAECPK